MASTVGTQSARPHGAGIGPRLAPALTRALLLTGLACVLVLIGGSGCGKRDDALKGESARLPAPDFPVTVYQGAEQLGGQAVTLAGLAGKAVVLNFYGGNCPPCLQEMPALQAAYQRYKDRVVLLGVDIGPFTGLGTMDEGKKLLTELNVTYPAGTTPDGTVPARYQLFVIPATVSVTPDGKVLRKYLGSLDSTAALLFFEELVRASGSK